VSTSKAGVFPEGNLKLSKWTWFNSFLGVAEKQDELKRRFKHPAPFSSPESATPFSLK